MHSVATYRERSIDVAQASRELAAALERHGIDYAFGGAIALIFWSEPRGTLDDDITLFLPRDQPTVCVRSLQQIGCDVNATQAIASIEEHGFCHASYKGVRVDVFLPTLPFYSIARHRREKIDYYGQPMIV
jgi:hypothetical protein